VCRPTSRLPNNKPRPLTADVSAQGRLGRPVTDPTQYPAASFPQPSAALSTKPTKPGPLVAAEGCGAGKAVDR